MEDSIKILILEHDRNDLELLQYALKKSGLRYIPEIVETREAYLKSLHHFCPDIILSDFSLPTFDGYTAFTLKEQQAPYIPFIIVSGTIGDENAVELIKNGVTDYVLKEKLYQLGPKILRALDEAEARKQKKHIELSLLQREEQLHKIMTLSLDIIYTLDPAGRFLSISPASKLILDYQPEELIGRNILEIVHEDDVAKLSQALENLKYGIDIINLECRYIRKSGAIVTLLWSVRWHTDEKGYGVAKDISEIKKAEERVRNNEKRFRALLQNSTDGLTLINPDGTIIERSLAALRILEISSHESLGSLRFDLVHPNDVQVLQNACANIQQDPALVPTLEFRFRKPDGSYKWIEATLQNQLNEPAVNAIVLNFRDISERKKAELALIQSEEKYRSLFELSPLPMWVFDVETYRFLNVNEAAVRHYGYSRQEFLNMTIKDIRPEIDIEMLQETVEKNKVTGKFFHGNVNHKKKNGEIIQVEVQSNLIDYDSTKARLVLARDISERVKYVNAIEEQNRKLRDIAWMQSHVVRAPLARIMGLVNLLEHTTAAAENFTELTDHLKTSANELDGIIKNIISETDSIEANFVN